MTGMKAVLAMLVMGFLVLGAGIIIYEAHAFAAVYGR